MQLPIGILSNTAAILCGGLLGALLGKYIQPRVQAALTTVFGLCSIAIGITLVVQIHALPAVVLSCILGTLFGEVANLQLRLEGLTSRMQNAFTRFAPKDGGWDEAFTGKFISILVLFCVSGTGILGAMTEGFTGDSTILLTKSIMDFFTAIIFAASLGVSVSLISLPAFAIFLLLFLLSGTIMPLTMPSMISDFKACGGILSIAVGLRLTEIKPIQVVNMLPSLILVMPVSYIWGSIF